MRSLHIPHPRVDMLERTVVVPIGESSEVGGFNLADGYLADYRDCNLPLNALDLELGI